MKKIYMNGKFNVKTRAYFILYDLVGIAVLLKYERRDPAIDNLIWPLIDKPIIAKLTRDA